MGVDTEMMPQGVAGDPFDHAFGQPAADHAGERQMQGGIGRDAFDPGPEVQHRFGAGIGGEILQGRVWGVDDVVDLFRRKIRAEAVG